MLELRYVQAAIAQVNQIATAKHPQNQKAEDEKSQLIDKIILPISRKFEDSDKVEKQIKKLLEELSLKKDDTLEKLMAVDTSKMDESQLSKHKSKIEKEEKKILDAKQAEENGLKEKIAKFEADKLKSFDNLRFLLKESEFKAPRTASEALKAIDLANASNEELMSVLVELREALEKNVKYLKSKYGIVEQTK